MHINLSGGDTLSLLLAMLCAALISFTATPAVRVLAFKIGAVDVPRDDRRMHDHPIPRLGGLAVFAGTVLAALVFCDLTPTIIAVMFGGLLIVTVGVLDDIFRLHPLVKFAVQLVAAGVAVAQGVTIPWINLGGHYIALGGWSVPLTILWIVGLTNAINLIDGLDGLSCGVSAICAFSLLLVTVVSGAPMTAVLLCAVITGACIGFLPFNTNPAKIFIGDTGALFLGYAMAVVSVDGVFKLHAVLAFLIPLSIFGLPLFDTLFAILRRLHHRQAPWHADHGHIHHRLIAMGFNQKQSVQILYAVCAILGLSAVLLTGNEGWRGAIIVVAGFVIFVIDYLIIRNPRLRHLAGLGEANIPEEKDAAAASDKASDKSNDTSPEKSGDDTSDSGK